jgi:sulfate adenylyltransferase subunit 2
MELKDLENKSVYVLREAKAQFKNPAILCSFGKDSTVMLHLIKRAFGEIPFPVMHLDTGYEFPETYEFRRELQKELDFKLVIARNEKAIAKGVGPDDGEAACCTALRTDGLKMAMKDGGYDALIVGIRRDEHGLRSKEHFFSPRDNDFQWRVCEEAKGCVSDSGLKSLQDPEFSGWDLYASEYSDKSHVRVHPLLHWTEEEVWEYIKAKKIKVNPLYFSKDGKRYRSLGCMPCTQPIESNASTVDDILEELRKAKNSERKGRLSTKEYAMDKLRSLGYM